MKPLLGFEAYTIMLQIEEMTFQYFPFLLSNNATSSRKNYPTRTTTNSTNNMKNKLKKSLAKTVITFNKMYYTCHRESVQSIENLYIVCITSHSTQHRGYKYNARNKYKHLIMQSPVLPDRAQRKTRFKVSVEFEELKKEKQTCETLIKMISAGRSSKKCKQSSYQKNTHSTVTL